MGHASMNQPKVVANVGLHLSRTAFTNNIRCTDLAGPNAPAVSNPMSLSLIMSSCIDTALGYI